MVVDLFNEKILKKEGDPAIAYAIERYEKLKEQTPTYEWLLFILSSPFGLASKFLGDVKLLKYHIENYLMVKSSMDVYRIYERNRAFSDEELLDLFFKANIDFR